MTTDGQVGSAGSATWPLHDYFSPGLSVVRPDACFPRMRARDLLAHPWKYLRRDVPHLWYADERFPLMGFLNRDEATLLHNIALQFAGKPALEIGSWLGWSTCHLALAGVSVQVIDPAHEDPGFRAIVEESLACAGVLDRVELSAGRSPDNIGELASRLGHKWSLFFIDGDHEAPGPMRDAAACLPHAAPDCAFIFHDLASPDVAAGLFYLKREGFNVLIYQTAQIMGLAWRGDVTPVSHLPDPSVAWQVPQHLIGLPISGVDTGTRDVPSYQELCTLEYQEPDRSKPTVCIVSNEVIGPFKNGGIGTSMTGLAELLASDGLNVTILYTGGIWAPHLGLKGWQNRYAELGISLVALSIEDMRLLDGPLKNRGFGVPYLVYRYLTSNHFDVVHFNDCCGEGSLALTARKLGLAFQQSLFVVALHSPSRWVLELNQTLPTSLLLSAYNYAEQLSLRCADMLWSPSRYMLGWARDRGFVFPMATFVQQYAMPSQRLRERASAVPSFPVVRWGRTSELKELVFFGRLEERKGLRLFCNALNRLKEELAKRQVVVTFLGKAEKCAGMDSLDYIAQRSSEWDFPINTITGLGQPEALQYLFGGEKLAVMPSPVDNSPCTVYEALSWGIPFLAARTGGIPELIHPDDRARVLFDYSTDDLCASILRAVEDGGWIARPTITQEETRRSWSDMHSHWRTFLPNQGRYGSTEPRRVLALVDHHTGLNLEATLQSLAACQSVRRVIVINRSGGESPPVVGTLDIRNIDLLREDPEVLLGELANAAAEAILMISSGILIVPDPLSMMLTALGTEGVEGLLPTARVTGGDFSRVMPPLGGSPAFSLYEGVTFTGALLVRGETVLAAKAGRSFAVESPFMGLADFCVTRGDLWPCPLTALERPHDYVMNVKSALPARVASYAESSLTDRYYMLATGYGAANGESLMGQKREVALALVDVGLARFVRIGSWGLRQAKRARAVIRKGFIGQLIRWMR
ncbi:MAG TPA: class I SAM-dependent methyltransferase [Thermoanaerobaculia bacterium]|nr:class I SAM-dependent methyltransferase [Thermoanaerobaculia bacterium]